MSSLARLHRQLPYTVSDRLCPGNLFIQLWWPCHSVLYPHQSQKSKQPTKGQAPPRGQKKRKNLTGPTNGASPNKGAKQKAKTCKGKQKENTTTQVHKYECVCVSRGWGGVKLSAKVQSIPRGKRYLAWDVLPGVLRGCQTVHMQSSVGSPRWLFVGVPREHEPESALPLRRAQCGCALGTVES